MSCFQVGSGIDTGKKERFNQRERGGGDMATDWNSNFTTMSFIQSMFNNYTTFGLQEKTRENNLKN